MPAAEPHQERAYLDYAATAPFDTRLLEPLTHAPWGNASSLHAEGQRARACLEDARNRIACALGAHAPGEIVFTSGGTEADNMALHGLCTHVPGARRVHVVVSALEHAAVLESAAALKARGFAVDVCGCDAQGHVEPETLEELLCAIEHAGDVTDLVAVQLVNNELGTVQPVERLAAIAHKHGARFFTDAVQALGKLDLDLEASGVDAAAFSAHKIGAPKGCGCLYVRRDVRMSAYIRGGGQESGRRSGTSNVAGAIAFSCACERACAEREALWQRASAFRAQVLEACATGRFAHALVENVEESRSQVPHILSLRAHGLEGETMVLRADEEGVAVSSGSACSSGSLAPSHVMLALGLPRDEAFSTLRVSFGYATTQRDIDMFIASLAQVLR